MLKNHVEIKLAHPHRTEKLQIMIRYSLLRNPFRQNYRSESYTLEACLTFWEAGEVLNIMGNGLKLVAVLPGYMCPRT